MFRRISQRLALLIAVAMIALWVVGLNAILQLRVANGIIAGVNENTLPSIQMLTEAKNFGMIYRLRVSDHILNNDDAKMAKIEQVLDTNKQGLMQRLSSYEKFISNDTDRDLLAADHKAAETYFALVSEVVNLSHQHQKDAARDLREGKLRPFSNALQDALDAHIKYNQHLSEVGFANSQQAQTTANFLTISLLIIATLVMGGVAWGTYGMVVNTSHHACQEITRVGRDLDFTRHITVTGHDEISEMLVAFNYLIERLRDSLETIHQDAEHLSEASEELASSSQQVTQSSLEQGNASATMASTVEQVTVSINHVSDRTGEASRLTKESGELAQSGSDLVGNTVTRIEAIFNLINDTATQLNELEESGHQIGAVVSVIKDVADQTNLLALNAAIEAARAGEQGRGFAVVADEVRKLAERTAMSTVEIAAIVETIQRRSAEASTRMSNSLESVRAGVEEGSATRSAIEQIVTSATQSSKLVGDIAEALQEQSSASNAIAEQVERVAQMAEENSRVAERSGELSLRVQTLAQKMRAVVGAYRL